MAMSAATVQLLGIAIPTAARLVMSLFDLIQAAEQGEISDEEVQQIVKSIKETPPLPIRRPQ